LTYSASALQDSFPIGIPVAFQHAKTTPLMGIVYSGAQKMIVEI